MFVRVENGDFFWALGSAIQYLMSRNLSRKCRTEYLRTTLLCVSNSVDIKVKIAVM